MAIAAQVDFPFGVYRHVICKSRSKRTQRTCWAQSVVMRAAEARERSLFSALELHSFDSTHGAAWSFSWQRVAPAQYIMQDDHMYVKHVCDGMCRPCLQTHALALG